MLVTTGATEAIAAALLALCEPGDEVVTFEPYYDSYAACIAMAGATRRVVTLRPPDYAARPRRARRRVLARARGSILLNRPHNPTGKVFSRAGARADRRATAASATCSAITDEVYEHLTFDGARARPARHAARDGRAHA